MSSKFMRISLASKETGIPESVLRTRLAYRRLPGFYSGRWFYVDVPKFMEMIEQETAFYSNGGMTALPKPVSYRHSSAKMRGVEYGARMGKIEAWEIEAEAMDREAEFATELRTMYDRGHFN